MLDNIERIQEDMPFRCVSVKHVVNERKQDGAYNFDKKRRVERVKKPPGRLDIHADREIIVDSQGTEWKAQDK
ncbi:MAG: hypothetical protein HUU08_00490 [Candidatus Brocadia sp.]|nr:hypothetical protein [Candidatus Brocadia sp.]